MLVWGRVSCHFGIQNVELSAQLCSARCGAPSRPQLHTRNFVCATVGLGTAHSYSYSISNVLDRCNLIPSTHAPQAATPVAWKWPANGSLQRSSPELLRPASSLSLLAKSTTSAFAKVKPRVQRTLRWHWAGKSLGANGSRGTQNSNTKGPPRT